MTPGGCVRWFVACALKQTGSPMPGARSCATWRPSSAKTSAPPEIDSIGGASANRNYVTVALPHNSKQLPHVVEPSLWKVNILLVCLNREAKRATVALQGKGHYEAPFRATCISAWKVGSMPNSCMD